MTDPSDDQAEAIAFLSRGAAYGQPDAAIERIDTHISVVFLVGDRVFKLKRALRFPFLDYSTVARREAMCRAELDLNRRTAPALYLAVHAVTRAPGGALTLDGKGQPIDWLVEMKRFSQDTLFDHLAEQRRLTPPMMRELADEIAAFHEAAERCDPAPYSAAMRRIVEDLLRNLRSAGPALDQAEIETFAAATAAALSRLAPLLDARAAEKHIRRCHGDLHLRNICLIDGKPTLFDGIEFNETFIRVDTLYDLAFLLMDLHHRELGDLANLILNRYLDRMAGDSGLPLLPFYLSVRAAVRAYASIASMARQQEAEGKRQFAAEAARYLEAALAAFQPTRPRLIAVGGLSGSGKSSLAQALAPHFAAMPGARILRSDVLRKRLFGAAPETRLPQSAYDIATNELVYRALYEQAGATLRAGYSAIADAAFLMPAERVAIAAVAEAAGVPFTGLWLDASADLLGERIAARTGDASDADLRVLEIQLSQELGPMAWSRLDAGAPAAAVIMAARRAIDGEVPV